MDQDSSAIHLNTRGIPEHSHDAIVIGSGISGGWAAKELCELGMKTLVLERGRPVEHIKDYPTATLDPWQLKHRGEVTQEVRRQNPLISKAAGYGEDNMHFFVKDGDHPYVQEKPFEWIRGYQVGGKSLTWGRCTQRWSDFEFRGPQRFSYGWDWPIRYADVAPWYSHVEKFIGVCGNKDGLESMPDGEFLPPFDLNCVERHLKESFLKNYGDRHLVHARWAHLTKPNPVHLQQGRGQCQARNLCMRGCPFGGYFSSNASTLPWAAKTGNLTVRPFSVVHSIIYDEQKGRAVGVRVVDAETKQHTEYFARIIFVNGSTLNSNLILLNSRSKRFPDGLGNDSGVLGKYICFHNYRGWISAQIDGFLDGYVYGRNPTDAIIANYRNLHNQDTDFSGGFTTYMSAYRPHSKGGQCPVQIGGEYKDSMTEPDGWHIYAYLQGETIPKETNHVRLSADKQDAWGIPLLVTSVGYDNNDEKLLKDFFEQTGEMLDKAGANHIEHSDSKQAPGLDIHEMGGCRMGTDPGTSMLDGNNALHHCKNVFVTDGACMASTGNQSPSILYMTLTARAAHYAVNAMKKGEI